MNLSIIKEETCVQLILEGTTHEQRQEIDGYNGFSESPLTAHCVESDLISSS